jgi:hypothetical protein
MTKPDQSKQDPAVIAARAIAQAEVARHWPELAEIEPTVAPRRRYLPDAAELVQLGMDIAAPAAAAAPPEYTFTFAGQARTPEGYLMPCVARVTVDAQRRVVKAIASK